MSRINNIKAFLMDSYANLINKLGARNDVTNINFNLLSSSNLCNIYQGDGVAKKIIDITILEVVFMSKTQKILKLPCISRFKFFRNAKK